MAIVKVTEEMVRAARDRIDWARIDAMTDEDIARQIAEDPDVAPDMSDIIPLIRARQNLGLSQNAFASVFGVSPATVKNWEQGRRKPSGPAKVLLMVIAREPEAVKRALKQEAE